MLIRSLASCALLLALVVPPTVPVAAQQQTLAQQTRDRANVPYHEGLAHLRNEAFDKAVASFQSATQIDPSYDMAFYMLGRAHLAVRNYAAATVALAKARDLFQADSTRQFTTKQERQQVLRDRIRGLEQLIEDIERAATLPANSTRRFAMEQDVRLYQERKRQLQDLERNDSLESTNAVPAFVSLSLGSAYFRSGKLQDAEQAYLAAIAADPKIGEAHNNLAVVYMETGRYDEAERAIKAAEKTGLKVNPALKEEIKKRRK